MPALIDRLWGAVVSYVGFASASDDPGEALREFLRYDDPVAEYERAVELEPNDAWLHYELGVTLLENREIDSAIDELRKAIELEPPHTYIADNAAMKVSEALHAKDGNN
jgi:tetratricopeptide (TPR) repeat protein